MTGYQYFVCPFVGREMRPRLSGESETLRVQLRHTIEFYSDQGWEYYGLESEGIEIKPGGLLVFRRPAPVRGRSKRT